MILNISNIFGYCAAFLTTTSFLPQVIKTIRSRKTDGISLVMYIMFCTGVLCWLIYGLLKSDLPIIVANGITLALASVVLFLKIKNG